MHKKESVRVVLVDTRLPCRHFKFSLDYSLIFQAVVLKVRKIYQHILSKIL